METQAEKVYVVIGTDLKDGFKTLDWAIKKWSSQSISIVILYAANSICKDYVYTPFGKLPASSVSHEKLEALKKSEQLKIDKTLLKYIEFCGKVKSEILNIDRYDEPTHNIILELILGLRITKLVMGITFMKSSWKYKCAMSGSFYIHRHKPDFCELFVICGGKLVFLREVNNEGIIEDDQGVILGKFREKTRFKNWLGKMFPENGSIEKNSHGSPSSSTSNDSPDQWEKNVEEIENYFLQLLSSNSDEEDSEVENDILHNSPTEPEMPENMSAAEKVEALKIKIGKAHEAIQVTRKEAKANVERHEKAGWAILLCTRRAEELEGRINEETASRVDLKKDLDAAKEELHEIQSEVEEKESKLNSILELQRELSNKLQSSTSAKTRTEVQLEKAVRERANMVRKIEEFRRQRDVMQRRIEFCKEKDAIGLATRLSEGSFNYKEYTTDEIKVATDDFSERLRLKSAGDWTNVYRGVINRTTVAIKLYDSINEPSQEAFQAKVKLLSHFRHPHLVAVLGFCSEQNCVVYEYMHNGCLRDALFSSHSSSRRRKQGLNWHARILIAAEVCSGLGFLHTAQPRPIVHGNLNPSNILLDRNNVAKIHGFWLGWCYDESGIRSDISGIRSDMRAFGSLVFQLLTGRNWAGLDEEATAMDHSAFIGVLDQTAGEWPLDLAMELARIASRCLSTNKELDTELSMARVMREIDEVRKKADDLVSSGECAAAAAVAEGDANMEESSIAPSVFLCPILQDVMKNPHVASDGNSYELEAIEEWLRMGHETSPITNLKLKHKHLTPNHSLRSLIEDWLSKMSIPLT